MPSVSPWSRNIAVWFVVSIAAASFAQSQEPEKKPAEADTDTSTIKIPDEPRSIDPATLLPKTLAADVTVEFKEASLTDVVKWLQTEQKLGVVVEQAALAQEGLLSSEPFGDKLTKAPLYMLLNHLRSINIGWYLDDGVVHLTTREVAKDKTRTVSYNVGDLFDAKYSSDMLLNAITQSIAPDSWQEVGGPASVVVLGDVLFVSQSTQNQVQVAGLLAALRKHGRRTYIVDPPGHEQLRAGLAKIVSVDFHDVPLAAAMEQLAKQAAVEIRLDNASLRDTGVRERQPVSLTLADQKLSVILRALLDKPSLSWVIRDGAIWIESKDAAANYMMTAVYDVRDLCRNADEVDGLVHAVTQQLVSDSWQSVGGPGSIEFTLPGTMVVRQSEPIHDRLLELLENYRTALRNSKARPRQENDPKQVITRYYRMPAAMAEDLEKALPELIEPDSWKSDAKPEAVGTIMKLASKSVVELPPGARPEAAANVVATPYAVLVIKQRREVHDKLPELLSRVAVGERDWAANQRPFVTSVVPLIEGFGGTGGGGFGGGGLGGVPAPSPAAPATPGFGGGLIGK